ncbi:exopolyphosphatase [Propionivibrio sp.]|uniref:exopolyphosphatase n=1 Tax=Propionivibrio sp. TaxID=2212460 RepID=UPI002616FDCC|nr:exopolyphosphatase [Propionivibrio sp.]
MVYEQIAAVDLGSNSFRLQIGRVVDNQIYPLDTLKESVRLASGLTPEKLLDDPAQQRALEALRRFGERLRGFQPEAVRVVATNTLRVAKNARTFIPLAEAALGFPIEIIGGREEARLIYIGAAHALPAVEHKRLVIDIGGGSTEFIIGKKLDPLVMESLFMGCVSYSLRFFPDGKVDRKRFFEAEVSAAREVQTIVLEYRRIGWTEAVASSGTARAIADLLECNGLNPEGVSGITREGLAKLHALMIRAGSAANLKLAGLRADRIPVLPGGVAIMSAIFSELDIERISYSVGALRLGVLYDLLGRFHHQDMRDATVRQFMRRYQVDTQQAERVEQTALALLGQLIEIDSPEHEGDVHFLRWAVALHEIGISISHSGFHKHGAYIVSYADMPGFSKQDQERLALLVLGQRGKLEKLPSTAASDAVWRLVFCLRAAVLLHRSRDDQPLPPILVKQTGAGFQLELPADWLHANPLSAAALVDEAQVWQRIGGALRVKRRAKVHAPE